MADQDKPRVKLPGVIHRKPLVPGPNSWAQSQQEQQRSPSDEQLGVGRVTNRDKYEHKPMPPPPADSSPHNKSLQAKAYIQPAIPLVNSVPEIESQQKRAVTDPVAPRPLFASRKLSVAKLRKKYSFSRAKDDVPEVRAMPTVESSPAVRLSSEKAAEVLGLCPPLENKPNTPPASAPSAPVPDPLRLSSDSAEDTASSARQAQSTPVPTRRYLRENDLPTPTITEALVDPNRQANEHPENQNKDPKKAEDGVLTPGMLRPPRLGRYGNVGEVGLVEANGMHRVESFSGIIESAESSPSNNGQMYMGSTGALSQSSMTQVLNTGDLLPPVIYSPSNYGGVWENDPAVGYSLPPFSPMPNGLPPNNEIGRSGTSENRGMPVMSNGFMNGYGNSNYTDFDPGANYNANTNPNSNTDRSPDYNHPFPSANSWVSGNSFTSTHAPLSALLPPSWPNHHSSNSVPSPPHNQHDYQRPGSMSAAMARLELTLHHHMDSTAGSLSKLITDKHDKMIDQTIRRLENLEETVSKGFRNFKADFKDIKKDIGHLKEEFKDGVKSSDKVEDLIKGLDRKLEALENGVEEHGCKCQLAIAERSPSEPEGGRQRVATSHRRTESANANGAVSQGDQRQQYQSGASRSSTSARHSGNSYKVHRSNTVSSQLGNRMNEEMEKRREYFAELGAARGPMPDLRDHPAYSGVQQNQGQTYGQDQNGMPSILNVLPYEHPSLSDGHWYQQAYGQGQ